MNNILIRKSGFAFLKKNVICSMVLRSIPRLFHTLLQSLKVMHWMSFMSSFITFMCNYLIYKLIVLQINKSCYTTTCLMFYFVNQIANIDL